MVLAPLPTQNCRSEPRSVKDVFIEAEQDALIDRFLQKYAWGEVAAAFEHVDVEAEQQQLVALEADRWAL